MTDREEKIKREIEKLFYKLSIVAIADMDKFEEERKKIRPIKRNWYDQLIKLTMVMEKKPIVIIDKLKDKIIRDIWTLFETEEEKKKTKEV